MSNHVVDLLDDDDTDEEEKKLENCLQGHHPVAPVVRNPYLKEPPKQALPPSKLSLSAISSNKIKAATKSASSKASKTRSTRKQNGATTKVQKKELQAGVVFEHADATSADTENIVQMYAQEQEARKTRGERPLFYHDSDFSTTPTSIQGKKKKQKVTCRCKGSIEAKLSYKKKNGRPYYHCVENKCRFFKWAFSAEQMQWYRFGSHNNHAIMGPNGFSADDLLQGKVGDCWFLSALAVVAERQDLIMRLFGNGKFNRISEYGMVQVNLFQDGYWKTITLDNFLPCMIDDTSERDLQRALRASLGGVQPVSHHLTNQPSREKSSRFNPHAISDECREILKETAEIQERDRARLINQTGGASVVAATKILERPATSLDLAYSKAKNNQLWVPFLEKAYAKSHGCYQAISGGWIAEAFLDLTGAPTLSYTFEHRDFDPRWFWSKLMHWRRKRLPMGCGTSQSQGGIIGMHAYSILDIREVKNVDFSFFQSTGIGHGNVSGFTEFDGKVRLLRIRNPHGQGEWKGEFSDKSHSWEKLLFAAKDNEARNLQRSMKNDGTFWMAYDDFLMGFHDVDVVLAFLGNHAKSFSSNFPEKKSSHRCARAFEVSLLDDPEESYANDSVELYIMLIQKTKRGARSGRSDRKVSYKPCDLGIMVGEIDNATGSIDYKGLKFTSVRGKMFGLTRSEHFSAVLKRQDKNKRLVVMPISFGHPAASDQELSFVLRFVSDAPLFIQECPSVPRMDLVIQSFCLSVNPLIDKPGTRKVLLQDSIYRLIQVQCQKTVFLYLFTNEDQLEKQILDKPGLCFSVEANCRGMLCRTENGLQEHETVAKGKKFTAAHRRYTCEFLDEKRSRLLLVLVQSGQDSEFNSIVCKRISAPRKLGRTVGQGTLDSFLDSPSIASQIDYEKRGIFNSVNADSAFQFASNFENLPVASLGNVFDHEIHHAMAISHHDLELQQALEISRREASSSFERPGIEHEQAITASKNAVVTSSKTYDDDLSKALQLSLQDQKKKPRAKITKDMVVDLTEDTTITKRHKTDTNEVVTILDDDEITNTASASMEVEDNKPASLEEKRKLAREAALKRLEAQPK